MTAASNAPIEQPQVLILAGTTASGKTGVSIPLAQRLDGEIINADSRQVYRELNIGTARPTPEQLAAVPHHFIGHISIHDRWTSGDFGIAARERIEEILSRGKTPLVVGGSMLYLRSLMDGFFSEDSIALENYGELKKELDERGVESLYKELQVCDPELASRTSPNDHDRILRGISVFRSGKLRLSELQLQPNVGLKRPFKLYFLHGDREKTYQHANQRALDMLDSGLIDEVRAFFDSGLDEYNCKALKTHGYQEVFPYLRDEITKTDMISNIQKAVRHYIKRQLTWFRADTRAIWIERQFDEPDTAVADHIYDSFMLPQEKAR